MMASLRGVAICLTLIFSLWSGASAQEPKEIFPPTTLIEMSPELAGAYHRLSGKIEASVANPALAEQLQNRLSTWLESAGEKSPTTFSVAHDRLMTKLSGINAAFDAARASGSFDNWPSAAIVAATPIAAQAPAAAAPAPQPEAQPALPPFVAPPTAPIAADAPPASGATPTQAEPAPLPAPAPASPPQAASSSDESKPPAQAANDADKPGEQKTPDAPLPTWKKVVIGVVLFVVGSLFWNLYPRFFQASADNYRLSAWGRLKRRIRFTAIGTGVLWLLLYGILSQ